MGKIISLANQKGGSGKTTVAVNLAVLWSNSEYKVAVIDADKQKSLTNWIEHRKKYYGDTNTGIDQIPYDPSNLIEITKEYKKKYDFIIIDSPPSISMDSLNIVRSSNHVFVPIQPTPIDLLATIPFLDLINKERKKSTIILNRVLSRVRLTDAMILRLRYSGANIARSRISARIAYAETFGKGRGIIDFSISSAIAKEIIKLGNEIIRKIQNQ